MNTQRETIIAQFVARLAAAPPAGAAAYRSRTEAFARDVLPAIVVKPESESPESLARGITRHELTLDCEVHVRAAVPDQAADLVIAALHATVMADPTLGGLCARCIEGGTKWEYDDADESAAKVTVTFVVTYLTTWSVITRQA